MSDNRDDDLPIYSQLILRPDERQAIGCVAVESSRLESFIEGAVWSILGVDDEKGLAVTGGMMLGRKLGLLKGLIDTRDAAAKEAFAPLHERITAAIASRNHIIHGYWGFPEGKEIKNYLRAMILQAEEGRLEPEATLRKGRRPPFKAGDVMQVARNFSDLQDDFVDYVGHHIYALGS